MGNLIEVIVTTTSPQNRHIRGPIVVIGVGLIGGSIAAAVRKRAPQADVIGVGRNTARLEAAKDARVLTHATTDLAICHDAEVVVACTPVDRLATDVQAAAEAVSPKTVLTDAGSVKGPLCRALADVPMFVGAHPLAGSEKTGWENSDADLYAGRTCVVTPTERCDAGAVEAVTAFWQLIGMQTVSMTPEDHDLAVAQTSHLPHIGAAAITRLLEPSHESLVAAGFRDTTRVASGDAAMWTAIVEANRDAVSAQLSRLIQDLDQLKSEVDKNNRAAIHEWFAQGARIRSDLEFN